MIGHIRRVNFTLVYYQFFMRKFEEFKQTNLFKVFLITFIAACIFKIFGAGYSVGQWLYYLNQ
jgi:hypothetical protein